MRVAIHYDTPRPKLTVIQSIQLYYTTGCVPPRQRPTTRKKITFEFQTIDSQLTARGAGDDAIGRKLDNAADAFTNKLFFSTFTRPCLLKFFTEKWVCITGKKIRS